MAISLLRSVVLRCVVVCAAASIAPSAGEDDYYGDDIPRLKDLYFQNPDYEPRLIKDPTKPVSSPIRILYCTHAGCRRVCAGVLYAWGRCNEYKVCVCKRHRYSATH